MITADWPNKASRMAYQAISAFRSATVPGTKGLPALPAPCLAGALRSFRRGPGRSVIICLRRPKGLCPFEIPTRERGSLDP